MRRKEKFKIAGMIVIIIAILSVCSFVFNRQLTPDRQRVQNFYKMKKNSLDVVLIGASTTYTDYAAPLSWKEDGFTSYSLGTASAPMGLAKSMLKEVEKRQKPKVIVIDINGILYNDIQESRDTFTRLWIDNMKISKNKYDTINELVPLKRRITYLIPFIKYHSNYTHISAVLKDTAREIKNNIHPQYLTVSGMAGWTLAYQQKHTVDVTHYTKARPMYKKSGERLKELLDYCKEKKLNNVIFTNMPRFYTHKMLDERERLNTADKLIKSYGYKIYDLDFKTKEIGLEKNKDFYNPNHLNIYGQAKVTRYLNKILTQEYHVRGTHDEATKQFWDKEYDGYKKLYDWADYNIKHKKSKKYNNENILDIIEQAKGDK